MSVCVDSASVTARLSPLPHQCLLPRARSLGTGKAQLGRRASDRLGRKSGSCGTLGGCRFQGVSISGFRSPEGLWFADTLEHKLRRRPRRRHPPPAGSPFLELPSDLERVQQSPAGRLLLLITLAPGTKLQTDAWLVLSLKPRCTLSHVWLAPHHFPS